MDDVAYETLSKFNLENAILIKLCDFEDRELAKIKDERSVAEYCWTCTPSLPLYILNNNTEILQVTYLDADLCFFSDPSPIFEEMGEESILIIEHRFSQRFVHYEMFGKYNVEFVVFTRDKNGIDCLNWWRSRCLEWCYNRLEDGKMGDQMYLNEWSTLFKGVHVLQHLGAGVAPWNYSQYEITCEQDDRIYINGEPLIFYHFHEFQIQFHDKYFLAPAKYQADKPVPSIIYDKYINYIRNSIEEVRSIDADFQYGIVPFFPLYIRELGRKIIPLTIKNMLKRYIGIGKKI